MLGEKRSKEKFNILKMSTHEKTTNLGYLDIVIFVWYFIRMVYVISNRIPMILLTIIFSKYTLN